MGGLPCQPCGDPPAAPGTQHPTSPRCALAAGGGRAGERLVIWVAVHNSKGRKLNLAKVGSCQQLLSGSCAQRKQVSPPPGHLCVRECCPQVSVCFIQKSIYSALKFVCGQQDVIAAHMTLMGWVKPEEQWVCLKVNVTPLVGL